MCQRLRFLLWNIHSKRLFNVMDAYQYLAFVVEMKCIAVRIMSCTCISPMYNKCIIILH